MDVIATTRLKASKRRRVKYPAWRKKPPETERIVDPVEVTMDPLRLGYRFLAFGVSTAGVLALRIIRHPLLRH